MFEDMWAYRNVLEEHRKQIASDDTRAAFDALVDSARAMRQYELIPTFSKAGRILRYTDVFQWSALFAERAEPDAQLPKPQIVGHDNWHLPGNRSVQRKRNWHPKPGDLSHNVLSTIAIGNATVAALEAVIKATGSTNTLEKPETAIEVLAWMATKYGISFTCRHGVVTGSARMLSLKPASPFELVVEDNGLKFAFNRVRFARVGGLDALLERFSIIDLGDGSVAIDVSTLAEAHRLHAFVFGGGLSSQPSELGRPYVFVGTVKSPAAPVPAVVDSKIIERGNQGHASTQDALAEFLQGIGVSPRSPKAGEPDYDLAWSSHERIFVAEVKSTTRSNEESQLRLGLGQVLRYRHALAAKGGAVTAVLVAENAPLDPSWEDLCRSLNVFLVWPGAFDSLSLSAMSVEPAADD